MTPGGITLMTLRLSQFCEQIVIRGYHGSAR
jgi:hypothetical protein